MFLVEEIIQILTKLKTIVILINNTMLRLCLIIAVCGATFARKYSFYFRYEYNNNIYKV